MAIAHGHIVVTPEGLQPYKVVFEHDDYRLEEYPVASIRDGEALIREKVPAISPHAIHTLRHWDGQSPLVEIGGPGVAS